MVVDRLALAARVRAPDAERPPNPEGADRVGGHLEQAVREPANPGLAVPEPGGPVAAVARQVLPREALGVARVPAPAQVELPVPKRRRWPTSLIAWLERPLLAAVLPPVERSARRPGPQEARPEPIRQSLLRSVEPAALQLAAEVGSALRAPARTPASQPRGASVRSSEVQAPACEFPGFRAASSNDPISVRPPCSSNRQKGSFGRVGSAPIRQRQHPAATVFQAVASSCDKRLSAGCSVVR
jgi:hypothetical protein